MLAQLRAALAQRPVLRAALTSGVVMSVGDATCQVIQGRASRTRQALDWQRSARFGVVGLTLHGPFFYHGFRWLDARFGAAPTFGRALTKVAAGQVTLFPVYLAAFFAYMGLLEGRRPAQCLDKVRASFVPTYAGGSVFWPLANIVNFMMVPPSGRVTYVNAAGLLWNSYLSWSNSRYAPQLEVPLAGGAPTGSKIGQRK